jgi:hypothetical protein
LLLGFFGAPGFDKCFQVGQAHLLEVAVLVEPEVYSAEGFGVELVDAMAAFAVLAHEMGATQKAQVPGDGRARDRKGLGDFSGGLATAAKEVEDGAAGGIGKGLEGGFRGFRGRFRV